MPLTIPVPPREKVTPTSAAQNPVVAQISNTVTRPGPLTSEWWTIVIAGAASTVLALTGLPGSDVAQVAGIVAPIVLALIYALVRLRTKGALAEVLQAVFPQADDPTPPIDPGAVSGSPAPASAEPNGNQPATVAAP